MAGMHTSLISCKQKLMDKFIHDADIVAALNPSAESPFDLIDNNIFPYFRVPYTDSETKSYITITVDFPEIRYVNNFARQISLKVCVIVHQREMKTDYGATRLDYIASKIDDILANSYDFGYGKLNLLSSIEGSLDEYHRYRELAYVTNTVRNEHC